jgi:DNA uptake protein ComE-like DNA-binding protein
LGGKNSSLARRIISILVIAVVWVGGASAKKSAGKSLVDINSAAMEELRTLPGIAEARARAIVKGRPYANKRELLQRKIVSPAEYRAIRELVIARH